MTPRRSFLASLILASAVAVSDVLPSFGFIREPEMVERLIWVPADRVLILGGGDGWYRVTGDTGLFNVTGQDGREYQIQGLGEMPQPELDGSTSYGRLYVIHGPDADLPVVVQ